MFAPLLHVLVWVAAASAASPISVLRDCDPPLAGGPAEIARWAAEVDTVGRIVDRQAESGDRRLSAGTLVSRECLRDPGAAERAARLERIVSRALRKAYACEKAMGLPVAGAVIPILRRARITCEEEERSIGAVNRLVEDNGYNTTGYDHRFAFNVPPATLAANGTSDADVASYLVHESLHSTRSNNTEWHNGPTASGHQFRGCPKSIFTDRIYFLHAICTPDSAFGHSLRDGGALRCPGVCEAAFTRVQGEPLPADLVGPPLNATPLTARQARELCQRLRTIDGLAVRIRTERSGLEKRQSAFRSLLDDAGLKEASAFLDDARTAAVAAYAGTLAPAAAIARVRAARERIVAMISPACAEHRPPAAPLCGPAGAPVQGELDRYLALLSGLELIDSTHERTGLPSRARVRALYETP